MTSELKKYVKRAESDVVAVQLALELEGFTYQKWGGSQRCKANDWVVNNNGDVYTVDAEVFAKTYREVSRGVYRKVAPVWAVVADEPGVIPTKEGKTKYEKGWYLVYNDAEAKEGEGWAVSPDKFEEMYAPAT
ncbi:MAG: hypothetical protein U0132_02075 [Gemmatimonadaceae bacterium]